MSHTISRSIRTLFAICFALALAGCASKAPPQPLPAQTSPPPAAEASSAQIANPASENCLKLGGTLSILERGDGGQYGVCVFEDNRQCEEWALLRGDCPKGGLKITGYVTPAAQYCVITGGEYQIADSSGTDQEQGTCAFKNGTSCNAWDYFNGKCDPGADKTASAYSDPFAYCAAVGTVDAPDARYTGPEMPDSILQGMIDMQLVSADAPTDIQRNAVWRCMDNQVWVCAFGANLPCLEKADASQTPTQAMTDYCKENPAAEGIPAYVTGRATVYNWDCKDGQAKAGQQVFTPDPQGFLSDFWYELTPK